MKNKIILSLVAIIFLSSCANKFSLTKRKYTKGYYFASSKSKTSTKNEINHSNLVVENLTAKKSPILNETNSVKEIANNSKNEILKISTTQITSPIIKTTTPVLIASSNAKNNFETKTAIKPVVEKQNINLNPAKKGSGDNDLIIQIILCFFPILCLIAVYLHDGKSITLNFWIDLLLHLTFIGEIIFAFLVVLDIVDLK